MYARFSDFAGNVADTSVTLTYVVPGDLDGSSTLSLRDAILALRGAAGIDTEGMNLDGDVGGNGKIGIEEAIFILRKMSK